MSLVHRVVALLGAAALAVALASCSGESAPEAEAGSSGQSAAADPLSAPGESSPSAASSGSAASGASDPEGDPDHGTVTVEIASGPHAGTHTRSGSLQCASIGDGRWVVFAPGDGSAGEIAHLTVYWMDSGIDRSVVDTPYPDATQLLELKFGSVLATGEDAISVSAEAGGTVEPAAPTFDEAGRPVYHFTATTADGTELAIAAAPYACPPY